MGGRNSMDVVAQVVHGRFLRRVGHVIGDGQIVHSQAFLGGRCFEGASVGHVVTQGVKTRELRIDVRLRRFRSLCAFI